MLKPSKNPYGFRNLLAYKKAQALQEECRKITRCFPKTKTITDLADQMDRSARSGKQNIVEGWKRNTTKEYFDFLGFSMAAIAELEEDCGDIWNGRYPELGNIKGEIGEKGRRGTTREIGEKGEKGEMEGMGEEAIPFKPISPVYSPFDIEKLPFYPLDPSLPPIVQLKLRAKELNYLLHKLQAALENKMQNEKTLTAGEMAREKLRRVKQDNDGIEEFLKQNGFQRLPNGQVIDKK